MDKIRAIEAVTAFVKERPIAELRVTDRKNPQAGEGVLFVGAENALQASFGKDELMISPHHDRFRLSAGSLDILRAGVGVEILRAAQLIGAQDFREEAPGRRPALNEPRGEYDALRAPIDTFVASSLTVLLRRFPALALSVIDLQREGQGDNRLCLGENETLQAEFGINALAVLEHSNRFKLTEESIEAMAQAQRELEQISLRGAEVAEQPEYISRHVEVMERASQEKLKQTFSAGLEEAIDRGNMTAYQTYLVISGLGKSRLHGLREMAIRAGFTVTNYFSQKISHRNYIAVHGDGLTELLTHALVNKCYGKELRTLQGYDPEETGPYALLFDPSNGILIILNKDMFIHPKT